MINNYVLMSVRVTSRGRHDVLICLHPDCLPLSQKASNAEIVSMSMRQHMWLFVIHYKPRTYTVKEPLYLTPTS